MSTDPSVFEVETSLTRWERGFDQVVAWVPYATLALSTVLAMLSPGQTGADRALSLGLAVGAAAWTYILFTRRRARPRSQRWVKLYFAGFIAFSVAMMAHQPTFFVYVITGFIHAFELRPAPFAFLGVGLTSLVVNSRIILPDPTSDELWTYWIIVVIQTVAVGFGIIGGEKIGELSEQRRRSVLELEAALEENAGLHAQLVAQAREAGVNDERERMAREIHDTIAQGLAGVITQLEAAGGVLEEREELMRRIENAKRLARESLTEARRSVRAVLPAPLVDNRLPEALGKVVSEWSTLSGVTAEVTTSGSAESLHPEVEVAVLRVAQEALANIAKHAGASRVGVTLSYMDDVVTLDVRDDGIGFSPDLPRSNGDGAGVGLTGMRQRVEMLSGRLEIESEPGRGTAVSATLPAISLESSHD